MYTTGATSSGVSLTVSGRTYVVVSVKACSDAQIVLATIVGNSDINATRVTLGSDGNMLTCIMQVDNDGFKACARTPSVLDCNRKITFWVTWSEGDIYVGLGGVIGSRKMAYMGHPAGLDIDINEIVFLTSSSQTVGTWQVINTGGTDRVLFTFLDNQILNLE